MKNDRAQMSLMWTQAKEILKCDFSEKEKNCIIPQKQYDTVQIFFTDFLQECIHLFILHTEKSETLFSVQAKNLIRSVNVYVRFN